MTTPFALTLYFDTAADLAAAVAKLNADGATPAAAAPAATEAPGKPKGGAKKQTAAAPTSPTATAAPQADAAQKNSDDDSAQAGQSQAGGDDDDDMFAEAAPTYTYDAHILPGLQAYSKKVDKDTFAKLMKACGVEKVPALKDKPELFDKIMAKIKPVIES